MNLNFKDPVYIPTKSTSNSLSPLQRVIQRPLGKQSFSLSKSPVCIGKNAEVHYDPMMSPLEATFFSQRKFADEYDWEETKDMFDGVNNSPLKDSPIPSAKKETEKRKTEICRIWKSGKTCPFADRCMFAHGLEELRSRPRPSNFRTKVCEDLTRADHVCCYYKNNENRCNFAHPGDALRVNFGKDYYDDEYAKLLDLHEESFPRGIFI